MEVGAPARRPISLTRTCIDVNAGSMLTAIGKSAKTITASWPGTAMRRRAHSNKAPAASMSLLQNKARCRRRSNG